MAAEETQQIAPVASGTLCASIPLSTCDSSIYIDCRPTSLRSLELIRVDHVLTLDVSEAPKGSEPGHHNESPHNAVEHRNGDSGPTDAANSQAREEKPTEDSKPEQLQTGEKREHDSTAAPADTDQPVTKDSEAPDAKKQKTGEDSAQAENGASPPASTAEDKPSAPETNGEKKKAGRPKKSQNTEKKAAIPTDGIGSRTRSRTKAS